MKQNETIYDGIKELIKDSTDATITIKYTIPLTHSPRTDDTTATKDKETIRTRIQEKQKDDANTDD